jgi:SAM-dependent methyltransferase
VLTHSGNQRQTEAPNDDLVTYRLSGQRRAENILQDTLNWSEKLQLPTIAIVGSGKMFNPMALNIDNAGTWNPDVIADIADPDLFAHEFQSDRFGTLQLRRGWFDTIVASHVLEHIPDLVRAMTNCLDLLAHAGSFHITVPYDLSYGAWQDPTHVHAFNERSWLYYCEWYWYLGWTEARFDLIQQTFRYSPLGDTLAQRGVTKDEILRTPRAVDEMSVVLRKRSLTDAEKIYGQEMRGQNRQSTKPSK